MTAKIKKPLKSSSHAHPHKPKGISIGSFEKIYWPYLPLILLIGFLSTLGFNSHALPSAIFTPSSRVLSYATQISPDQLLASTNEMRTLNNVKSLKLNSSLDAAAQAKANDMATRNYWSHTTPDGSQPWTFVSNQNYAYQKLGENLAAGFDTSDSAIKGWMASATHRDNLLDPTFTEVGFGFANNPNFVAGSGPMTIVVAFYGRPQSAPILSNLNLPSSFDVAASSGPATTLSNVSSDMKNEVTTHAQLAFYSVSYSSLATYLTLALMSMAIGIWIGRHVLLVRRAIKQGERYVMTHPLLDFSLLIVAGLSFILTKTAGFII